jgi:AraC-like DNA-binding protein
VNIWESILLFFSFQALLLAILFLVKQQGNLYSNRLFALLLLLFAYNIFFNVLFWSKFDPSLLATLGFSYYIPFALYGPVYFFYLRHVITEKKVMAKDWPHLVPFFFVMIFYGKFYFLPTRTKIEVLHTGQIQSFAGIAPYLETLLCGLMLGYALFTYNVYIKKYKEDLDLTLWLRSLSTLFTLFVLAFVIFYILVYAGVLKIEHDYLLTFLMVTCIGLAAYFSFMQPEVFNGKPINEVIPFMHPMKYEKAGLPENFSKELKKKLEELMERKKPYLNPDLRLNHLADLLDLSRHHTSQVINEHFGKNFFEYINRYRLIEAERLLENKSNQLSISAIAFECGFNNRVSFYKAFKKKVGITPTEFRDQKMAS